MTSGAAVRVARFLGVGALLAMLVSCGASTETAQSQAGTQAQVLADAVVTAAEYRASVERVAACVNEQGWETTTVRPDTLEVLLTFDTRLGDAGVEAVDRASADRDECYAEYLDDVERAYFRQHIPTGAARDALMGELLECLATADVVGASAASTEQEIVRLIAEQHRDDMGNGLMCLTKYRLVFPEGMFPE